MSRPPSAHPDLPGFEYEKLLGSGGFADVFLYRQFRPQRRVAIKVLLANVGDESVRRQFDGEANVMASMSTHPSIVTIYTAEVSSSQRPYLVMEYCPRPNYGVRFRKERISAVEALRVGVQIAGAVETAHRAGILHRDIKPANILVTDYNRPALTDFGISIVAGSGEDVEDSQGMSIPWSPPEFFLDPPRADARSDVFSLAATVYSLLAGRTPFEVADRKNTAADLIHRIGTEPLRPLNRPDVPEMLDRVLSTAMAKDPVSRYDSALALGRALQQVEMSMSLPITQMDVLDDRGAPTGDGDAGDDELDGHTRIRKVLTVSPEAGTTGPGHTTHQNGQRAVDPFAAVAPSLHSARPAPSAPSAGDDPESTMLRPVPRQELATSQRASPVALMPQEETPQEATKGTPAWPFVLLASLLVVVLGVGATFAVRILAPTEEPIIATSTTGGLESLDQEVAPPGNVAITEVIPANQQTREPARARVTWETPENYTEDQFIRVTWTGLPEENYEEYTVPKDEASRDSTMMTVPPNLPGLCVEVRTLDRNGGASAPQEACLPET